MIDRRNLLLGTGMLASGLMRAPARAAERKVVRMANTVLVNDAQQVYSTVGQHPRLGYYAQEGIELEYVNMSSIAQAMQSMITGEVLVGPAVPGVFLPAYAKNPAIGLIAAYEWLPRNPTVIVVKPDSSIKTAADLEGKRVGIRNQGDPGNISTRTMLLELGLDDDKVQYIAIGDGAPAGQALMEDRVDAMVSFDTATARIELIGYKLRYVPITPRFAKTGGGWNLVKKSLLKDERKTLVGYFRAKAKSTLFAYTNLDQSIDLHWDLYPESRPKSKTPEEAKKEIAFLMKDRRENWMRWPDDPDQRIGAMDDSSWKLNVELAASTSKNPKLPDEIGPLANIYTNDLIDEINAFDRKAIIEQARSFRFKA